ncbi:hypothetical protein MD484_g5537, partial [Candolleomyces efflorescens]
MDGEFQGNQPRIPAREVDERTPHVDERRAQSTAPSSFRRFNFVAPSLPDIPTSSDFDDLELAITSVAGVAPTEQEEKVHKRASSVLKLTEENEKLKAELKAMTDRIEAIERQKMELRAARAAEDEDDREFEQEQQHIVEPTSS